MSVAEKRTQMYFPMDLYRRIEKKSKEESKSVASIVREAIEKYLNEQEKIDWDNDPIFELAGIMDSKTEDLSENHDKYLYGKKDNQ